jgi:lysophospholipase L1-like esterase
MKPLRYLKIALNAVILLYVGVVAVVFATGGFSFTFFGATIRAHNLIGPLLILAGASMARAALALPPKNLVILAVSLMLTLFSMEGMLRWWYPKKAWPVLRLYYRPAPEIGYELIPGVAGTGSFGEAIIINSHGLRDVERPWEKPPGVKRVLVLGDSFTFGMKVEASSNYPKALEALLNEASGKWRYDIINAGVVAYSLCQERKWLEIKGWRYEPDLVVVGFFGDDPHCQGEVSGRRFAEQKAYRTFTRVSVLYNFLKNSYNILSSKYLERLRPAWTGGIESRALYLQRNKFTNISEKEWAGVAGDLEYIEKEVGLRGAKLLVVVIPDVGQLGSPELQSPNRKLLDICESSDLACIDTTPLIEEAAQPLSLYLYPLDAHLSPAGHRLVARAIADWISAEGP